MRHVSGQQAAHHLGAALWVGQEAQEAIFPWPYQFSQIADWYAERYGLRYEHLAYIARLNLSNARRNPNAQARTWQFTERSFALDDVENPVIEGRLRKQDCGRITDGAATVLLASDRYAREYAKKRGRDLTTIPLIKGWGHRTAPLRLADKFTLGQHSEYPLPHLRQTITDAYRLIGQNGPHDLDAIETHDCFTITEYIALDHFGLTPPGKVGRSSKTATSNKRGAYLSIPVGVLLEPGIPSGPPAYGCSSMPANK